MTKLPEKEIIVLELAGNCCRVENLDGSGADALLALGFCRDGKQFIKAIEGSNERKRLSNQLIEIGAVFSAGPGWSPAELLSLYEENGTISKSYRTISWRHQESYFIEDHTPMRQQDSI